MSRSIKTGLVVAMLLAVVAGAVFGYGQIVPEAFAASKPKSTSTPMLANTGAPVEGIAETVEVNKDFFIFDKELLDTIVELSQFSNKNHDNEWGFQFVSAQPEEIVWNVSDSLLLRVSPTLRGTGKKPKFVGIGYVELITVDAETGVTKGFRRKFNKNSQDLTSMFKLVGNDWENCEYFVLRPSLDADAMITTFVQDSTTFDDLFAIGKKAMPKNAK